MFRSIVAVFTALCLLSCTTLRTVSPGSPAELQQRVKVGDEVSVSATNGKTYLLTLTAVDKEKIVGVGDNKKVTIRYGQITHLDVRRVSAGKTVAITAGVVTGVVLVVLAIAIVTFGNALDDAFTPE